jgi:hypothetical protein
MFARMACGRGCSRNRLAPGLWLWFGLVIVKNGKPL